MKKEAEPIGIPDNEQATIEGLIDLLVLKGIFTDDELMACANRFQAIMNGLVDILTIKGVITARELEIARNEYHQFVQAEALYRNIPPSVLFQKRRAVIKERIDLEKTWTPK